MPQAPYRALGILLRYFILGPSGKFKDAPSVTLVIVPYKSLSSILSIGLYARRCSFWTYFASRSAAGFLRKLMSADSLRGVPADLRPRCFLI